MLEILKTLKDTPLPSILVIGGIIFLLLSYVRKIGSSIELEPEKKGSVGFIGFVLLCAGIGLYMIPAVQALPIASATATPIIESPSQVAQTISTPTQKVTQPSTATIPPQLIATATPVLYDGWVICWHGRDGYEYLIAYPEADARQGVNLNFNLTNAQGRQVEVANDSLKMCYVNGEWYGYPDPNEWFPKVSYLKLTGKEILVCFDSPGCQGGQWTIRPEKYYPWDAPELESPKETGIHIMSYKVSFGK
jgi:hypothetical protein